MAGFPAKGHSIHGTVLYFLPALVETSTYRYDASGGNHRIHKESRLYEMGPYGPRTTLIKDLASIPADVHRVGEIVHE